jgi:hypothetical protein
MTKYEAAVVSAYTGYMLGDFEDMQKYAEKLMGQQLSTIAFASPSFVAELKAAAQKDFVNLNITDN